MMAVTPPGTRANSASCPCERGPSMRAAPSALRIAAWARLSLPCQTPSRIAPTRREVLRQPALRALWASVCLGSDWAFGKICDRSEQLESGGSHAPGSAPVTLCEPTRDDGPNLRVLNDAFNRVCRLRPT